MKKILFFSLIILNIFTFGISAQEAEITQTYEVVTTEEANKDLYEKLNKKKKKRGISSVS